MTSTYTTSIKQNIKHVDIKQFLTDLGVTPEDHFMTNCKLLSQELNNRGYTGKISQRAIRKFIDELPQTPPLEEESIAEYNISEPSSTPQQQSSSHAEFKEKLLHLFDEEEQQPTMKQKEPSPSTSSSMSSEQKTSDDELFTRLSRENAELKARNKQLEENERIMKAELAEQHRELREELEAHEKSIMEMETFTDTRSQLSSEECQRFFVVSPLLVSFMYLIKNKIKR